MTTRYPGRTSWRARAPQEVKRKIIKVLPESADAVQKPGRFHTLRSGQLAPSSPTPSFANTQAPATAAVNTMAPMKRLAVLSDGTWKRADSVAPTNILALARALCKEAPDGTQQVIYYAAGVGAKGSLLARVRDGAVGGGIDGTYHDYLNFVFQEKKEFSLQPLVSKTTALTY